MMVGLAPEDAGGVFVDLVDEFVEAGWFGHVVMPAAVAVCAESRQWWSLGS
jgi:hypothetical protein